MKDVLKYLIVILGIIGAILAIVYGSYLPLTKSKMYIAALRDVRHIKTVQEFEDLFNKVFDFYSPVGDEEVPKFLGTDILNLIANGQQGEQTSRALVKFIEPHLWKDNVRHLLLLGQMFASLWQNFGRQEQDFNKAESYLREAYKIGPKLPPVLYTLFDLYRANGDKNKVQEIGNQILKYWPDDEKVKNIVENL